MVKLTNKQQEIVDSNADYISIVAGAGSGKTRVITNKIIRSLNLLKNGQKILAITFSNKATEELKERLVDSIGDETVAEKTYIGTIHNLCNEILMTHGFLIGINDTIMICSNNDDRMDIFKKAVLSVPFLTNKLIGKDQKEQQLLVNDWLNFISRQKRNLKFASDYEITKPTYLLFKEFDDQLLNQGMIDFDDIVRYTYKLLVDYPEVLKMYQTLYKEIFVDEAQDINFSQYEIIKLLAGKSNKIVMVGDPNQAIYGFSGGSPEFLATKFCSDYNVKSFTLNENFRSAKSIISASNLLEANFKAEGIYPINGEFAIHQYDGETSEAVAVVEKIKKLLDVGHQDLDGEKLKLENCAVIARNRYVFNSLIRLLNNDHIPYTLKVSPRGSFSSESDLIRIFELGLILLGNKLDLIHVNELNEILHTKNLTGVNGIIGSPEVADNLKAKYKYVVDSLGLIDSENVNLSILLDKVEKILNDQKIVLDDNEKELIQEDIKYWRINWKNYIRNSSIGERTYTNFIRKIPLLTASIETTNNLTLSTVHMSKGLEYDVVFVIGLNDGVFPDYRSIQELGKGNQLQMDEEKHNLFVAITRAKRLCYLSFPKKRLMPWGEEKAQSPSRLLKVYEDSAFQIIS